MTYKQMFICIAAMMIIIAPFSLYDKHKRAKEANAAEIKAFESAKLWSANCHRIAKSDKNSLPDRYRDLAGRSCFMDGKDWPTFSNNEKWELIEDFTTKVSIMKSGPVRVEYPTSEEVESKIKHIEAIYADPYNVYLSIREAYSIETNEVGKYVYTNSVYEDLRSHILDPQYQHIFGNQ